MGSCFHGGGDQFLFRSFMNRFASEAARETAGNSLQAKPRRVLWRSGCSVLLMAVLSQSAPAGAIIVRHDVAASRHQEFAEPFRKTVVDLAIPRRDGASPHGNGAGTLIAPRWVLTAAHVAAAMKEGHPLNRVSLPHQIYVDGEAFEVEAVFIHPDWRGDIGPADIALLRLSKLVPAAVPACLYGKDGEVGQTVIIAGMGETGTGLTGPAGEGGALLAATAKVTTVEAEGSIISWTFRPPDDPEVTALEGISGPGDSGGPALVYDHGRLCVAGVSSAGDGMGNGRGRYGSREFYTRVSTYRAWLESVMEREDISITIVCGPGATSLPPRAGRALQQKCRV